MKNLRFLLAAFVLLAGCATPKFTDFPGLMFHIGFDFREYSDKGFLFTPEPYSGEHTVRGMVTFHLHPRVRYVKGKLPKSDGFTVKHFRVENYGEMTQIVEDYKVEDLIQYIYELSIEWGGDAFTHFEHRTLTSRTDLSEYSEYPYAVITGVVIKRH